MEPYQQTNREENCENTLITPLLATNRSDNKKHAEKKSGVALCIFNLSNCIIGSGIITLPYVMTLAGLPTGLILICVSAIVTSLTLTMLAFSVFTNKEANYMYITKQHLGVWAELIVSICHILFPIFISLSYTIVICQNMQTIISYHMPQYPILYNRYLLISLFSFLILLPISAVESVSILAKFSTLSICFCLYYTMIFIVYTPSMIKVVHIDEEMFKFSKSGVLRAFGALAFAMTPHHNFYQIYRSIRNNTERKTKLIINTAIFFSFFVYVVVSYTGFVTFAGNIYANVFENYCPGDILMDVTRIIFAASLLLTYPLQIISSREVIISYITQKKPSINFNKKKKAAISTFLVCTVTAIAMTTDKLGYVIEIGGALTALPLSLIFPQLIYMKANSKHGFKPYNFMNCVCWATIVFGLSSLGIGLSLTVYSILYPKAHVPFLYFCKSAYMS